MGFWGDIGDVLTGAGATYHTFNVLGMADSGVAKTMAKSNPLVAPSYQRHLSEDKDKPDQGKSESMGFMQGSTAAYRIGKAAGIEDSGWYQTVMKTHPLASGPYNDMLVEDRNKESARRLNRGMQIGAYSAPDLSNQAGAYTVGRK